MSEMRLATLLLTDLVDSTKLVSELGDDRAAALMARHDRVARDLLAANQGREIDKSDGFLLLFDEAIHSAAFASAYHAALRALSAELGVPLAARAGMHTGEVRLVYTPAADVARGAKPIEVEGIAKPTAARIMTLAIGSQTLMSEASRDALGEGGPEVLSHGFFRMKGVPEPMELFELADEGAPMRPPADTAKVYRVVQTDGGWVPAREIPNNLPVRGALFGRKEELRALAAASAEGAQLLTLVGPGGTGKTALACAFAAGWLGEWPGGAWFCDLSESRSALAVVQALGRALGVPLEQGEPSEVLGMALAARGSLLVILDNTEQVIPELRVLLEALIRRAPGASWLLTSRQRLGLRGERIVLVEPLALPADNAPEAEIAANPAVQLFVERARAVQPSFVLDAAQAGWVLRLVKLLDGLPLAIELAAARVRVLPPRKILERMGRRFDLLKGVGDERRGTLRGALDWSWELLAPFERDALAQSAVFEGGFDLEAAEAVLDLADHEGAPWAADVVESLVEKSLVRAAPDGEGGSRFSLLRSIHDYALEKLAESEEAEARHAAFYAHFGDQSEADALYGPDGRATYLKLERELDNLVIAATRRARSQDGDLAAQNALGALAILETSGPFALAQQVAHEALDADPPPQLKARLQLALGVVRNRAGLTEEALEPLEQALATARGLRDRRIEAAAMAALGQRAVLRREMDEARERYEAALAMQRAAKDRRGEAMSLAELGHVVGIRGGDFAAGGAFLQQAMALFVQRGDRVGQALTQSYLGAILAIQGDFPGGRAAYERARALAREVGDRRTEGLSEGMIANICQITGDHEEARRSFETALRVQASIGDRVHEAMHAANYADLLALLGEDAAACGHLEHAIELARDIGDRVTEGQALATLGMLRARMGDAELGRQRLIEGEARLREAGDPTELAKLLCKAGELELAMGDSVSAALRLEEAMRIAMERGHGEGSEVVSAVDALARALGVMDS